MMLWWGRKTLIETANMKMVQEERHTNVKRGRESISVAWRRRETRFDYVLVLAIYAHPS